MIRATAPRLLTAVCLLAALIWSTILARAHLEARATVLDRLEASLVDVRFLAIGRRPAPSDVLIVAVDDAAIREARGFPLPRRTLARLVTALLASGAKVVALDLLFLDPTTPEDDDALAQALTGAPAVAAATIDYARDLPGEAPGTALPTGCTLPIEPIRRAASIGFVNIVIDRSGEVRHVPMVLPCDGGILPAFALRAANLAAGADPAFEGDTVTVGGATTPLDAAGHLALRFYGPEGSIDTVSAADVLTGQIAPERVRGRTIAIGATARGAGDRYATPFDPVLPGVEILATAIANLETGDALERTGTIRRIDAGLVIALAPLAVLLLGLRNIGFGIFGVLALVAGLVGFTVIGFAHGYWFALAMPLASLGPVVVLTGAARLGLDRWTERRLRAQQTTLGAFQSPAILRLLNADPEFLSRPVERDIAAVFIDLTGFTGLSERLGPQPTRDLLKDFHDLVEDEVSRGGGIVATYMADGAMLVWGMAGPVTDDAARAVRTAVSLQARTLTWLAAVRSETGESVGVKVGGHWGPAILSRLGHASHQHITAIGDTVNVASRLMEVAAGRGSLMAVSARLLERARAQGLGAPDDRFTDPADVSIRGREHSVSVCLWRG